MTTLETNCKHNVPLDMPCPWCGRNAQRKSFRTKYAWQLWQIEFQNVIKALQDGGSQGPASFVMAVEDLNGVCVTNFRGPTGQLKTLHAMLGKRIQEMEGKCLDNKSENGFGKLFKWTLKRPKN